MQKQSNQTHWYEILKKEREQRSWTQEEVAEKIGVAVKSIGRWESGKHLPIALHRRSLCTIYEKTLHELRLDEEPSSYKSISSLNGKNGNIALVAVLTSLVEGPQNRQFWKRPFVLVVGMMLAVVPFVVFVRKMSLLWFTAATRRYQYKCSLMCHLCLLPLLLLPFLSLLPQQTL